MAKSPSNRSWSREQTKVGNTAGPARPAARLGADPTFKARLPDDIAVKLLYVNFKDQMEFPRHTSGSFPMALVTSLQSFYHRGAANSRSAWTSLPGLRT